LTKAAGQVSIAIRSEYFSDGGRGRRSRCRVRLTRSQGTRFALSDRIQKQYYIIIIIIRTRIDRAAKALEAAVNDDAYILGDRELLYSFTFPIMM